MYNFHLGPSKIEIPGNTFSFILKCPADAPNMDIVTAFWLLNPITNCGVDVTAAVLRMCTGTPSVCPITNTLLQILIVLNPCGQLLAVSKTLKITYRCTVFIK